MTAGSRDDCKATQIKCYNGTSSNGLGKTRRAMKKPERATPGKLCCSMLFIATK